jgi:hypothetical protein
VTASGAAANLALASEKESYMDLSGSPPYVINGDVDTVPNMYLDFTGLTGITQNVAHAAFHGSGFGQVWLFTAADANVKANHVVTFSTTLTSSKISVTSYPVAANFGTIVPTVVGVALEDQGTAGQPVAVMMHGVAAVIVDHGSFGKGTSASPQEILRGSIGTTNGIASAGRTHFGWKGYNPGPQIEICAQEDATCTCTGTVFYGRKFVSGQPGSGTVTTLGGLQAHTYVEKAVTGSIVCNTAAMGSDPANGYTKHCICKPRSQVNVVGVAMNKLNTANYVRVDGADSSLTKLLIAVKPSSYRARQVHA